MTEDKGRWERYLFEWHSRESVAKWAPTLRFFRYCRAFGGHAGDGDSLRVALKFESRSDLERIFSQLGIPLVLATEDEPRPIVGKPYPADQFSQFRSTVRCFPDLVQPGYVSLAGVAAFVWVYDERLTLDCKGENVWDVDETAIASARRLEPLLESLAGHVLDPPEDTPYCVCPRYYPEMWDDAGTGAPVAAADDLKRCNARS